MADALGQEIRLFDSHSQSDKANLPVAIPERRPILVCSMFF